MNTYFAPAEKAKDLFYYSFKILPNSSKELTGRSAFYYQF